MDEFAQTRLPDDLFDDDFTPITEPSALPTVSPEPKHGGQGRGQRGHWEGRPRGRGRRRSNQHDCPPSGESKPEDADGADQPAHPPTTKDESRPEAVKGDRSGTGGVKMKKLTEDELSARLASIKLKNAALEEAHRRAEADEALFHRREQQEASKRREERANRREMEGERERNRLRKMKAVQGREWDAEKNEEDLVGGGDARDGGARSRYRRGAHGGVVGDERVGYTGGVGDGGGYRGRGGDYGYVPRGPRGRGGRGARGARGETPGRGRGAQPSHRDDGILDTSAESQFPALPASSTTTAKATERVEGGGSGYAKNEPPPTDDGLTKHPLVSSPEVERGTWAEQMEVGTSSAVVG